MESILPDSYQYPYLVYYYYSFCPRCALWTKKWMEYYKVKKHLCFCFNLNIDFILKDFRKIGIKTASINVIISTQARLYSKVNDNEVPLIALILNGQVYHFKNPSKDDLSLNDLKSFVKDNLPSNINEVLNDISIFCRVLLSLDFIYSISFF